MRAVMERRIGASTLPTATRHACHRAVALLAAGCCLCCALVAGPDATTGGHTPAAGWHTGELGPFRWTFRESRRLPFGPFGLGDGQHRRTFIWLGAAAAAPQVAMEGLSGGKLRQPLPMPTAWATVANVLYVGCRNTSCGAWCCGPDVHEAPGGADDSLGPSVVAVLRCDTEPPTLTHSLTPSGTYLHVTSPSLKPHAGPPALQLPNLIDQHLKPPPRRRLCLLVSVRPCLLVSLLQGLATALP